jgi:hypothetical protein
MTHLNNIVEAVKNQLNGHSDYITVIVTVLLGTEDEVTEAERTISSSLDVADLPCKCGRIMMGDWKGKARE